MAALLLLTACLEVQAGIYPTPSSIPTLTPTSKPNPHPLLSLNLNSTPAATPIPLPTATPASACSLSNLWLEQHISARGSYTETQTEVTGPMICRIERDSCAYHYLIGDLNPAIIYKQEEEPPYNREDILMHPAMILPLSRLSKLVIEEWGGAVNLRVTDAYDSLLEHDLNQSEAKRKQSLHFEGRAIDLTTSPIDINLYPRLCALAHCAGFDWVQNEGDHCHAAVKAESLCHRCRD